MRDDLPTARRLPGLFLDEARDPLGRLLRAVIVAMFTIMVLAALTQVIFRYFVNYPLGWTGELAQLAMMSFAYLAVGPLARRQRMMRVDALLLVLPNRGRAATEALVNLLCAGVLGWFAWLSIRLMELASGQVSTALKIPYPYIYLSVFVGLGAGALYCLGLAVGHLVTATRGDVVSAPERRDD